MHDSYRQSLQWQRGRTLSFSELHEIVIYTLSILIYRIVQYIVYSHPSKKTPQRRDAGKLAPIRVTCYHFLQHCASCEWKTNENHSLYIVTYFVMQCVVVRLSCLWTSECHQQFLHWPTEASQGQRPWGPDYTGWRKYNLSVASQKWSTPSKIRRHRSVTRKASLFLVGDMWFGAKTAKAKCVHQHKRINAGRKNTTSPFCQVGLDSVVYFRPISASVASYSTINCINIFINQLAHIDNCVRILIYYVHIIISGASHIVLIYAWDTMYTSHIHIECTCHSTSGTTNHQWNQIKTGWTSPTLHKVFQHY